VLFIISYIIFLKSLKSHINKLYLDIEKFKMCPKWTFCPKRTVPFGQKLTDKILKKILDDDERSEAKTLQRQDLADKIFEKNFG